jgi:hypothetical protein
MTAIRNFPNAPVLRREKATFGAYVPGFAVRAWQALQRSGQLRAARELELLAHWRATGDPALARQLRATAADCRASAKYTPTQRRKDPS